MAVRTTGENLRVGLVGAGGISSLHAAIIESLPDTQLVAVCDSVSARAEGLAREFRIPEMYDSAGELLRKAHPNVVHVLTPPQYHVEVALECLRAGCHVLVEKPLGLSSAECERLRAESERTGRLCGVNHNLTYAPVLDRLILAIRSRKLGRVNHTLMNFCVPPAFVPDSDPGNYMFQEPGNLVFEFGPHPFSVIHLLMGAVVRAECFASGERQLPGGKSYFDSWQIALECERGTASLFLSIGRGVYDFFVRILGQDGTALADLARSTLHVTETSPRRIAGPLKQGWVHGRESLGAALRNIGNQYGVSLGRLSSRRVNPFFRSLEAFHQAVRAGKRPREDAAAGRAVVKFCEETAGHVKFARADKEIPADANR